LRMTWIDELPDSWCPPHATNPNLCGSTSFQLSSNFGDSVTAPTAPPITPTTPPTTPPTAAPTAPPTAPSTVPPTAQPTTPTAPPPAPTTSAAVGTCTGEPCLDKSHCRSKWGWCNAGASYCNSESTWTPQCVATAVTTAPPVSPPVTTTAPSVSTVTATASAPITTTAAGSCTGEPCPNKSHCRSKWGWCNAGAAYCNDESTWKEQCSNGRLLLAHSTDDGQSMQAKRHDDSIMV